MCKKVFRLFWRFGPRLALRAATRTIGFAEAVRRAGDRLGLNAKLVVLSQPEAGIDVDKLSDYRLAELILLRRENKTAQGAQLVQVAVFDLDRTITRRPTYTPFLIFAASRCNPLRLLLAPLVIAAMVAHKLGLLSRKRTKEIEHLLLLGGHLQRTQVDRLATAFAARLRKGGFFADALEQIHRERAQGRQIVLATAATRFYSDAIAHDLGIEDVVGTAPTWSGDTLLAAISGPNCYGADKLAMIEAFLEARGLLRASLHVRFFSDHKSDRATFEWADQPVVVNPSRALRRRAMGNGWDIVTWR